MDGRGTTILLFYGGFILALSVALTGLINSFLPAVEKPKRIKRIAIIFFVLVILMAVGLMIAALK